MNAAPRYAEPARRYTTTWVLLALMLAAFGADVLLGGARDHLLAWVGAVVAVVGVDALTVHAARSLRSVTVTDDEVRVGENALPRAEIVGVEPDFEPGDPILGRLAGEGLPRGARGLAVRLADGSVMVIPTRAPDALAHALQVTSAVPEVRPAEEADLAAVAEIHERALALFTVAGFALPADAEPVAAAAVLVAGRPPCGAVEVAGGDGDARITRLSVLPARMRTGIGTALLDAACTWAGEQGYPSVSVLALREVPWQAPFFTARGFVAADPDAGGRHVLMRRRL